VYNTGYACFNAFTRAWLAAILFACFFPLALVSFVLTRGLNLCARRIVISLKKYADSIAEIKAKRQVQKIESLSIVLVFSLYFFLKNESLQKQQ